MNIFREQTLKRRNKNSRPFSERGPQAPLPTAPELSQRPPLGTQDPSLLSPPAPISSQRRLKMKRSEVGVISNLSGPESLAPTSDVSMLDVPTLVGAPRIPVDTSDSQRRGVGSSQSPFCNELDRIREDSR